MAGYPVGKPLVYLFGGKETPITDCDGHTIAVRLPYAPAKDEKTGNLYAVYVDDKGRMELSRSARNRAIS